jgi:hypothetical protein
LIHLRFVRKIFRTIFVPLTMGKMLEKKLKIIMYSANNSVEIHVFNNTKSQLKAILNFYLTLAEWFRVIFSACHHNGWEIESGQGMWWKIYMYICTRYTHICL